MTKIDTFKHKQFVGELFYNKETKIFWSKIGPISSGNFETPKQTIDDAIQKLDSWLNDQPLTFEELAKKLESCLEWHSYEDCTMDAKLAEIVIKDFVKTIPQYFL